MVREINASVCRASVHPYVIAAFSLTLLAIGATWSLLFWLLLEAMLGSAAPVYAQTIWGDVLVYLSGSQLLSCAAVGAILATIAFALSVVSVPMMLDSGADARTAMSNRDLVR